MPSSTKDKQRLYDLKRAGMRTRNWTVVVYPEDLPEDWAERLEAKHVKWIQSPLHDKDLNADGTPKKPHYHILLLFESIQTVSQVEMLFKGLYGASEGGSIVGVAKPQQVSNRGSLVRYFAHMDNPEKFQYDPQEIKGHCGADVADLLKYSQTETIAMMVSVEEFIEQNGITEYQELCKALRYDHPDWYQLVATKNTVHFSKFITSFRHRMCPKRVDPETGEVLE